LTIKDKNNTIYLSNKNKFKRNYMNKLVLLCLFFATTSFLHSMEPISENNFKNMSFDEEYFKIKAAEKKKKNNMPKEKTNSFPLKNYLKPKKK
jgi:hypothetical protein